MRKSRAHARIKDRVRLDAVTYGRLINRYLGYFTYKKYDDSGKRAEDAKVVYTKSFYQVQWQNIKSDLKFLVKSPRFAVPVISLSLASFLFLFNHDLARTIAMAGAIGYDTGTNGGALTGTGSVTWNHTATGSNLGLFAAAMCNTSTGPGTATYNGDALTMFMDNGNDTGSFLAQEGGYIIGADSGTNAVIITQAAITYALAASITVTGTNAGTGASVTNVNTPSTSSSKTITSAVGSLVIGWIGVSNSNGDSSNLVAGQTDSVSETAAVSGHTGSYGIEYASGAASVDMTWSWTTSTKYIHAGMSFDPVIGSSPSPSVSPSVSPSISPSKSPSISPSPSPGSTSPSVSPSLSPSKSPSVSPSKSPSISPSASVSVSPSVSPSKSPSLSPSPSVSISPSASPSLSPSSSLSPSPSAAQWTHEDVPDDAGWTREDEII